MRAIPRALSVSDCALLLQRVDFHQGDAGRLVRSAHDGGVRRGCLGRLTIADSSLLEGGMVVASISDCCASRQSLFAAIGAPSAVE